MKQKRLRMLDHPWHQVHAYRLHALPADFTYLITRQTIWNEAQRPIPPNFRGAVSIKNVRAEDFDVALAHLDQWCDGRHNLRARPFRIMKLKTEGKIPLVVIMHGTPDNAANREALLRLMGDLPVVCNSEQAAREWDGGEDRRDRYGLPQFRPIIHGYDASEFWSQPLDRRGSEVVTICSGGNWSRIYHGIPLVERLKRDVPLLWLGPRGDKPWKASYDEYRQFLSETLIYFSPTRCGPMPGARTEAMLSGCCVVTVPGHDVEKYIVTGRSGFIVNTYQEAMNVLLALLNCRERAWQIGQVGREAASKLFAQELFVDEWKNLLHSLGVC